MCLLIVCKLNNHIINVYFMRSQIKANKSRGVFKLFFVLVVGISANHMKYILEYNNTPCNTGAHDSKMNEDAVMNNNICYKHNVTAIFGAF